MKSNKIITAAGVAALSVAAGVGLYLAGLHHGQQANSTGTAPAAHAEGEKKVLYWHDPMVPGQKFDKPGKSPFMDMQLVPVYAENAGDASAIRIDPRVQQNLGIRTASVSKGMLSLPLEAVGSVAYNERDVALVQARSNGYVERLYVRAPLDPVRKGQALAELYVPDWVAAQEDYLSVKRMARADVALLDAARQRMRLAGMTDEQIRIVESSGAVRARLTVAAPISGVVTDLAVREGMTVATGAPMFRINGMSSVWILAEVAENQVARVKPGSAVQVRTPALPGSVFSGKVGAILPEVNATTRTVKARIEVANPAGQLTPGMFVSVALSAGDRVDVLLVPTEAVIQTGTRAVVMVAEPGGKFRATDVEVGVEANGQSEIRSGLEAGQTVVVSGQFLVDSEASLKGTATRMAPTVPAPPAAVTAPVHRGEGKVERIGKDEVTLSHGPIASLQWGAMTMGFKPPAAGVPAGLVAGDTVTFGIRQEDDGMYRITDIAKRGTPASSGSGK
ncbi:efflux RND transporter periplasmic adaptor subunit [Pseudoduganella aquatica]|uniref:efflux RND transporter periplasmic adaptor subunit n=1 Tax=Pseudoduganella aquatica TaxID=2660641 RepID=UPI001E4DF3CA|nr:efflux RND transporter periplasmic adaptor subunit [Pseudoduganella aquatica]